MSSSGDLFEAASLARLSSVRSYEYAHMYCAIESRAWGLVLFVHFHLHVAAKLRPPWRTERNNGPGG